jgi:hypothetical protein
MIEADGDVHLLVRDLQDTTITMIMEIPDASCPQSIASGRAAAYDSAKRALLDILGAQVPTAKIQTSASHPVIEVTGVGFYDIPHFQGGAAKNNIEIHPVVGLRRK